MENKVSQIPEFRKYYCRSKNVCLQRHFYADKIMKRDATRSALEKSADFNLPFQKRYLSEFELFDGEEFVTFNIVGIDTVTNEITVAVTNRGKISVIPFTLMTDSDGKLYFEYGVMYEKVNIDNFDLKEN